MTTLARTVFNQWDVDNMTFDRIVSKSSYQNIFPVQVDNNLTNESTAYIFEDGSALINKNEKWEVKTRYGLSCDNSKY